MPGGSSRQLRLLQQHHILHATFGQVIRHAGPHTSTTNDDSFRRVLPPLSQNCGCITERKERRRRKELQVNNYSSNMHLSGLFTMCTAVTPATRNTEATMLTTGDWRRATSTTLTLSATVLHKVWLHASISCAALRALEALHVNYVSFTPSLLNN